VNNRKDGCGARSPEIWAIGGGKGGVGKSLVSILLAMELAQQNQRTILIDADLGGANLHTLMGIKTPSRTINDFIMRRYASMEEICLPTALKNLQIVAGASEILSLANPQYAQKNKIVQSLSRLAADHVVLDLGAGTSYNVLDFFLIADHPIVVVTPQPISIQNAYGFVRNAVYRKLSRLATQHTSLHKIITQAMDPKNENQMHTIPDLFANIRASYNNGVIGQFQSALAKITPWIVTNIARDERDDNAGRIIQLVSEKYLAINVRALGAIHYDPMIDQLVSRMAAMTELPSRSRARDDAAILVKRLLNETP
jgi:flagellar biosynthesis protein FlhG